MQHLKPGNLIAVRSDETYHYFLILTDSAFFGCQWTYVFHATSQILMDSETILSSNPSGFTALIDFIEERSNGKIVKMEKGIDVLPFLTFEHLRARIDEYNGAYTGRFLWFIYNKQFKILEKLEHLRTGQEKYPIGSGLKCRDAIKLIGKKYAMDFVFEVVSKGQFPLE